MTKHQAGFVNIIGKPNVGKSTLMNALTGENISIITPKAQTTRQRILGIVNEENYQIVFSDTPGILQPQYRLQQAMMREVESAFEDADIILYLVEAGEMPEQNDIAERIIKTELPVILIINKIDLTDQAALENKINRWQEIFPSADIIPVSALLKANLQSVFRSILEKLPENPPYYDKDELTDKTVRYFVAEKIREKILLNYQKEIPYSVEVAVDQFKESDNLIHIIAYIYIARESQKAILLGHQGSAIKRVGTQARRDLEEWLGKKIFLELSVKVLKDWRDSEKELRKFGYDL
ncbi:MAG: GTPase Era [Bacteroidales bacterium]|jgi:GTP-binding protein Era|nr:GTPase Era [Bacteroidales bacterium]